MLTTATARVPMTIAVVAVLAVHLPLGDMTTEDARAEGMEDLDAYQALILRMHKGMGWDPEHRVWIHESERVKQD